MSTMPETDKRVHDLTVAFHDTYERLAPEFSYKTRRASAVPWESVPPANRALMYSTVAEVVGPLINENERLKSGDWTDEERKLFLFEATKASYAEGTRAGCEELSIHAAELDERVEQLEREHACCWHGWGSSADRALHDPDGACNPTSLPSPQERT